MPKATTQENRVGVATLTVATGAVVCAACCILPIAVPAVALAGLGAVFAWLNGVSIWFTAIAIVVTTGAWIWIGQQSVRSRAWPASATLFSIGTATALVVMALLWPLIESPIRRAFHI